MSTSRRTARAAALAVAFAVGPALAQDAGTGEWVYDFQPARDGAPPSGGVAVNDNGEPIGVTSAAGLESGGAIYVSTRIGGNWGTNIPFTFGPAEASGYAPLAPPFQLGDRTWLGTTSAGAGKGAGSIWRFHFIEGHLWSVRQVLHNFDAAAEGMNPAAALVGDHHHDYFGTLSDGGPGGAGSVFEMQFDAVAFTWHFRLLHAFTGGADGGHPSGQIAVDRDGVVYGTVRDGGAAGLGGVWRIASHRALPTTELIVDFHGSDGATPVGGIARTAAGELFGTTSAGGAHGDGVVFRVQRGAQGAVCTVLHDFADGTDGRAPLAPIRLAPDGRRFYGSASAGGANGGGLVFSLTAGSGGQWSFAPVYSLGPQGNSPVGALGLGPDGTTLYGVAALNSTGLPTGSLFQVQLPQ